MTNYVDILTVYDTIQERNLDFLGNLYKDRDRLHLVIHKLVKKHLKRSDIEAKNILLKPNWVRHELKEYDFLCLRTNDNLLLCILEEVLSMNPAKVLVADAPVQGCIWNKMITKDFELNIQSLSQKYNTPIAIKDFRRTITDVARKTISTNLHPMSDYIMFDLGTKSFLEPITALDNKFRVTCYNPDRMAQVHHKGTHQYCIAKEVFDYDVIITIPKLKTHRMAGMTNALKLLVGINGDKDYLPHHRIGSLQEGGDNYKEKNQLRTMANRFIDASNRRRGTKISKYFSTAGALLWKYSHPDAATMINAGWYGNDTIWRTVMDINTIAFFGDGKGKIHEKQQRCMYTIMDGIVGGQGDGPLHPTPSALGVVGISNNPYLMDVVAGELYHLNHEKIPLLNEAHKIVQKTDHTITINSTETPLDEVAKYGIDITMSPGWVDYNK